MISRHLGLKPEEFSLNLQLKEALARRMGELFNVDKFK